MTLAGGASDQPGFLSAGLVGLEQPGEPVHDVQGHLAVVEARDVHPGQEPLFRRAKTDGREGRGTERTLVNCGLDLRSCGNVSVMSHTADPRRFSGHNPRSR